MNKNAFSLVELSIVLVILGLLVGGILAGQSLIQASQLRAVTTEYQKYYTAGKTFRDKYFALPGDMTNATAFWSILAGTGSDAACQNTAATAAATCNGNGNGVITTSVVGYDENVRFFQHLANAGLLEGSYTGTFGSGVPGVNVGASKFSGNTAWLPDALGVYAGTTEIFAYDYGNAMDVYSTASNWRPFTPSQAWNIDTKVDDGMPAKGILIGHKGSAAYPCTSRADQAVAAADASATYTLSSNDAVCALVFAKVF